MTASDDDHRETDLENLPLLFFCMCREGTHQGTMHMAQALLSLHL